ncbi:MAG: hypothetical protein K5785_00855 [Nitrosarchaeum sp.]|nr:hypothetical protein [Nitrosarchaeum sp.]
MSTLIQVDEITPTIAKNLSESEKKTAIEKLQKQEEEIRLGISNPQSIIHITAFEDRSTIFTRWANHYKQLHYLGVYEKPINTISTHIRHHIGKMDIPLEKKESLYHNLDRYLTSEYKLSSDNNPQNEDENTSDFCNIENSFMYRAIASFKSYHEIFSDIADTLLQHLADPTINKEFCDIIEWEEISEFCAILETMQTKIKDAYKDVDKLDKQLANFSTLEYIKEDLNIRQSADSFRDAMFVLLGADKSFRKMAHKFGISPRQNQRVRNRLDDWPKKDARKIIQMVMGSYLCPCGCGMNLVTNRRHVDITDDKFFLTVRYRDRKMTLPEKFRQKKDITPIAIAENQWGKKLQMVEIKR